MIEDLPERGDTEPPAIPKIYSLDAAADLLGVHPSWLRNQLSARKYAALKRGNRWAMTELQILDAIEAMTVRPREPEPEPPFGLSRRSWILRQRRQMRNTLSQTPKEPSPPSSPVGWHKKVTAGTPEEIAKLPDMTATQIAFLGRLREEGELVVNGQSRKTVEALTRRGLADYEVRYVLNENGNAYVYRFTVRPVPS